MLDSVCCRKGERRQEGVLSWGLSLLELSPVQVEGWRTPRLCCSCPGAELEAVRQEGWSPAEADDLQGPLSILPVGLTSLPLLCPSSSRWC